MCAVTRFHTSLTSKNRVNLSQEKEGSSFLPTKFSLIALEPLIVEEENRSLHQLQWEEQKITCIGDGGRYQHP